MSADSAMLSAAAEPDMDPDATVRFLSIKLLEPTEAVAMWAPPNGTMPVSYTAELSYDGNEWRRLNLEEPDSTFVMFMVTEEQEFHVRVTPEGGAPAMETFSPEASPETSSLQTPSPDTSSPETPQIQRGKSGKAPSLETPQIQRGKSGKAPSLETPSPETPSLETPQIQRGKSGKAPSPETPSPESPSPETATFETLSPEAAQFQRGKFGKAGKRRL